MSFSVQTFLTLVLLTVGLLSTDGTKGYCQKTLKGMDYRPVLNTSIGKLIFEAEISQELKLNGLPQDSLGMIQETKQTEEVLTGLEKAKVIKFMHKLRNFVLGVHPQMDDVKPDQENLSYQILPTAEKEKERKGAEQLQVLEEMTQKIPPKSLGNRVLLRMMDRGYNYGSNLAALWRRGDEKSTETNKSEKDRQKTKESNSQSSTTSKLSVMIHPIKDVLSKTKQKMKPSQTATGSLSKKTKKSLSIGLRGENSAKSGDGTRLASKFTSKPSGFGRMTTEYPGEGFTAQYQEASHPREQSQTFKRKVSKMLHRNSRGTDKDEISERSPPRSPSMSYEVNLMWDFINRVSKEWRENENVPAPNEDSLPPEKTQPILSLDSQSPKRNTPNVIQNGERKDFLLAPMIQSSSHFQSPHIRTYETKEEIEGQEDENIINYIIQCRKGWFEPKVAPVTGEHNELPPDSFPSPTRSPTGPPARSPPQSSTRHPSKTRFAPPYESLSPNINPNPRQQLKEYSNKQFDDGYATLANKIKSFDRLGQISEV